VSRLSEKMPEPDRIRLFLMCPPKGSHKSSNFRLGVEHTRKVHLAQATIVSSHPWLGGPRNGITLQINPQDVVVPTEPSQEEELPNRGSDIYAILGHRINTRDRDAPPESHHGTQNSQRGVQRSHPVSHNCQTVQMRTPREPSWQPEFSNGRSKIPSQCSNRPSRKSELPIRGSKIPPSTAAKIAKRDRCSMTTNVQFKLGTDLPRLR
jgi:hypothetical protein